MYTIHACTVGTTSSSEILNILKYNSHHCWKVTEPLSDNRTFIVVIFILKEIRFVVDVDRFRSSLIFIRH